MDGNDLRRLYYWEAPERYRKIRLGYAVAASACVPGLFEPLRLDGLYPDRTVRLVDGGVHDNQGVGSLLERDCNVLLVSDASGQMGTLDDPGAGTLGVMSRSNSVLISRVRTEQYEELAARLRARTLGGLMFVHLKKGLPAQPVSWLASEDPVEQDPPQGTENKSARRSQAVFSSPCSGPCSCVCTSGSSTRCSCGTASWSG